MEGVLIAFCLVVVFLIIFYVGLSARILATGQRLFAYQSSVLESAVIVAVLCFGLFWTLTRNRRTPTYWKWVFGLMALSGAGNVMSHHAGSEDTAWLFWGVIWLLYWSRSRRVALTFTPNRSRLNESRRSASSQEYRSVLSTAVSISGSMQSLGSPTRVTEARFYTQPIELSIDLAGRLFGVATEGMEDLSESLMQQAGVPQENLHRLGLEALYLRLITARTAFMRETDQDAQHQAEVLNMFDNLVAGYFGPEQSRTYADRTKSYHLALKSGADFEETMGQEYSRLCGWKGERAVAMGASQAIGMIVTAREAVSDYRVTQARRGSALASISQKEASGRQVQAAENDEGSCNQERSPSEAHSLMREVASRLGRPATDLQVSQDMQSLKITLPDQESRLPLAELSRLQTTAAGPKPWQASWSMDRVAVIPNLASKIESLLIGAGYAYRSIGYKGLAIYARDADGDKADAPNPSQAGSWFGQPIENTDDIAKSLFGAAMLLVNGAEERLTATATACGKDLDFIQIETLYLTLFSGRLGFSMDTSDDENFGGKVLEQFDALVKEYCGRKQGLARTLMQRTDQYLLALVPGSETASTIGREYAKLCSGEDTMTASVGTVFASIMLETSAELLCAYRKTAA